ncbi:hypothetical protein [Nocardia aurantiaca]|uniref:Uncharacterized protein n=1 Tax=Nocardia aurantiaca TaxID=2675850 RepID=A0A6I3L5X0_9NOCA|nr:hypothetical protein [Nocardia aurantiaca]MTE16064.1 hypothetical protein [Nocardia aurantiaca]
MESHLYPLVDEVYCRAPTALERVDLSKAVQDLAIGLATKLVGMPSGDWESWRAESLDWRQARELQLALLQVQTLIVKEIEAWMPEAVSDALDLTATFGDIAAVIGLDRQLVHQRWGNIKGADSQVALVISRRSSDEPATVGAVYDEDRRCRKVSLAVRRRARHAIVAVDGIVCRVYELEPDSWIEEIDSRTWMFNAIGRRSLVAAEVNAAYYAGLLPLRLGDVCPARSHGACATYYFPSAVDLCAAADLSGKA